MNVDALEDFQRLWLMNHARVAFLSVNEASSHILKHDLNYGDELFYPLFTSIVINYARPFKRSKIVGKLIDDMVPFESQNLHQTLITMRDTLVAHSDGNAPRDKWGKVNEVRYVFAKSHNSSHVTQFHLNCQQIKETQNLSKTLIEKTDYHINKLERKHADKFPKRKGEFILNVDPEIKELFIVADIIPEEECKTRRA
jgi:hypothetical protein